MESDLRKERQELLARVEDWLEVPMIALGFVWLLLLILELTGTLPPLLERLSVFIWIAFLLDFGVRFVIAPAKARYLRSNWLTLIALILPALRVLRIVRVARILQATRAARGLRLVRVITSLNRGMRALGASMSRRGFGYALSLTAVVTFTGAAGMYAFENEAGLQTYGSALWWTAMLMTTLGSEYWPKTPEGRLLCVLLALYAFAVFGYVTAFLASFFIGRDAENTEAEIAGANDMRQLQAEIEGLRQEIRQLRNSRIM
jgi:voltage-gated potassium channel